MSDPFVIYLGSPLFNQIFDSLRVYWCLHCKSLETFDVLSYGLPCHWPSGTLGALEIRHPGRQYFHSLNLLFLPWSTFSKLVSFQKCGGQNTCHVRELMENLVLLLKMNVRFQKSSLYLGSQPLRNIKGFKMIWTWIKPKSHQSGLFEKWVLSFFFTFTSLFHVSDWVCGCPLQKLSHHSYVLILLFIFKQLWLFWWNMLIRWNLFSWYLISSTLRVWLYYYFLDENSV